MPCISAFVGADIVAELAVLKVIQKNYLFLDIGTNGEIALVKGEKFLHVPRQRDLHLKVQIFHAEWEHYLAQYQSFPIRENTRSSVIPNRLEYVVQG